MSQAKWVCYLAINWVLICIADPLEQRCFPSIRPPDNEDTEMGVLGSDFRSFFWVNHYRWYTGCRISWSYSWGQRISWRHRRLEVKQNWKRSNNAEGEFEQLEGIPCDPLPNIFLRRLRNPLDSFCRGRLSAISMRDGDKKWLAVGHPRGFSSGWSREYL